MKEPKYIKKTAMKRSMTEPLDLHVRSQYVFHYNKLESEEYLKINGFYNLALNAIKIVEIFNTIS